MLAIRTATHADLDAVIDVGRATWPDTFSSIAGERYVHEGLARWWTYPSVSPAIEAGQVVIADRAGQVVGMALFRADGRFTILDRLYVLPYEQGRGVGSALVNHVRNHALSHRIRLTVLADNNAARRFYAGQGFRTLARTPDAQGGPDRLTMQSV